MSGPEVTEPEGAALWRAVASGGAAPGTVSEGALARFAELASPVLADHLLGGGLLPAADVEQSRLNNRFRLAAQRNCLTEIGNAGIEVVAIKGFALAHTLYPAPDIRAVGDLDILVQPRDRDTLLHHLTGLGYTFEPLPRPPWGFISEASYAPFVSADSACNLDVHIHPDCYPAYRSLTTDLLFERSVTVDADGYTFRAASADHAFLLCATNAAKDKFGPFAARKIADAMRLVAAGDLDWDMLDGLAEAGGFRMPFRVFVRLLAALGVAPGHLPAYAHAPLPARTREEYRRMLAETLRLYPTEPGLGATLRRELLLSTEPAVGLRNAVSRLRGLVRRGSGVPAPPA
ncbi:MAG: nucleotidyltransferase family protein [Alphaproteobacteria bacterium]|nr:nucleotidyltransferase family protein [Alphaproteobacteria bacterium]